jgi:hypothetical protein
MSLIRQKISICGGLTKAGQETAKLNAASEPLGEVVACSSVVVTVWRLSSSVLVNRPTELAE